MKLAKRIIALSLVLVLVFALAACANGGEKTPGNVDGKATVKIATSSAVSWPYEDSWKIWQYMREYSGFDLDVQAIPGSDYPTKTNLMFAAPDTLPDLMYSDYKPAADTYARDGGLVALDDYKDIMPNYNKHINSLSEEDYNFYVTTRRSFDGKIYLTPYTGSDGTANRMAWMYRKDIFDKHNLKVPTTMDELYEVAKELKKLYPDSYPICSREVLTRLNMIGPSWSPYFVPDVYYNFDDDTWHYGAVEDTMLDIVKFLNKLYTEGLVPPDFLSISTSSWQELVTTDRGFIMPEYSVRIDFFNPLGRQLNPDFNLTAFAPPAPTTEGGRGLIAKTGPSHAGYLVCNTMVEERIENAMKFVDWMYSDEAYELTSWGKKGETYEIVDGKKQFILDEAGNSAQSLYGVMTPGSCLRADPEASESINSPELLAVADILATTVEENSNPAPFIAFNDEESDVRDNVATQIGTYQREMLSKFILGQKPLSEWDEFVTELKALGVDDLLAIYESAYNRVK